MRGRMIGYVVIFSTATLFLYWIDSLDMLMLAGLSVCFLLVRSAEQLLSQKKTGGKIVEGQKIRK